MDLQVSKLDRDLCDQSDHSVCYNYIPILFFVQIPHEPSHPSDSGFGEGPCDVVLSEVSICIVFGRCVCYSLFSLLVKFPVMEVGTVSTGSVSYRILWGRGHWPFVGRVGMCRFGERMCFFTCKAWKPRYMYLLGFKGSYCF